MVLVVAAAAFGVYRLHGVFGSTNINQAVGIKDDSKNIIPKDIVYEIFGPAGTKGEVNYLDDKAQPQRAVFTTLPWKLTITTTMTSVLPMSSRWGIATKLAAASCPTVKSRTNKTRPTTTPKSSAW